MQLKAGGLWHSAVSDAQVIVVRAPGGPVELTCGGLPMLAERPDPGDRPASPATGTSELLIGKRYVDEAVGLELLCTKPGAGPLACGGRVLEIAQPKQLPSSD